MKKHHFAALCAAFMLCVTMTPAFAAENDQEAAVTPPPPTFYPAEVRTSQENGITRLEKVYYLTAHDDPAAIPTGDFEREGRRYTLLDVLKTDMTESDTKDYAEVITLESKTKDLSEIIPVLEPELEVTTEDGYLGTLRPDYTSIQVEAAGYKNKSWTVSANREYPNLSDADVSLLPKSIEDGGRTLTLADVSWQESGEHYNAIATYTGTANSKYATGYNVTVDYTGEVTKTSCDTVVYTAVFSSTEPVTRLTQPAQVEPEVKETIAQPAAVDKRLIVIPLLILVAAGAFYLCRKGYIHLQNKKRGYE